MAACRQRPHPARAQPRHRRALGRRTRYGRKRNPRRGYRRSRRAERLGGTPRRRTQPHPAPLVQPDDDAPRRSGAHPDRRTRQAAGRSARRNRLRRILYRMVCRRSQARLRRHHPRPACRSAHQRHPPTRRRVRRHHAVELPQRHDYPQSRARTGGRLHLHRPPRIENAAVRTGGCRGRAFRPACSTSSPARPAPSAAC